MKQLKKLLVIIGVGTLVLFSALTTQVVHAAPNVPQVSDQALTHTDVVRLIVKVKPQASLRDLQELHSQVNGTVIDVIPQLDVQVVQVPASRLEAAIAAYRSNPNVLYVEQDALAEAAFQPNDPYFTTQQYGPQIMGVDKAWDITTGSSDVLVAVVDTGADFTHPDLAGKLVPGYDFVNDDADPADDNGHGTHVAGIIAAATNNGIGIAGVGYQTRVLVVKVLDQNGSGYYSTISKGITYAADRGARIINLSLRGTVPSTLLEDAVNYAWSKGALVVAAAGNDGSSAPVYPAAYTHAMAVAATNWNDERWTISNYGDYISVAAPGVGIYSTDWQGGAGPYASRSGTSMAAPHVAGVAALMLAVNPDLTNDRIQTLLEETAVDLGDPGWDPYFGFGRVDAYQAVVAAGTVRAVQTATLGDRVWVDSNGNGIQDAGENGLANVTVTLYAADGTQVATTTDANGQYTFTNITPGDYYLRVILPAGYAFTPAHQGTDDTVDSDVDPTTGQTPTITLVSGQTDTTWDVGLIPTVRLGGTVWLDPNANGYQDPNETTPVPGVPVHIFGVDITGASVDVVVVSGSDGRYEANTLLPGTYTVEAPYQFSGYVLTTATSQSVMLTVTQPENLNVNFGYIAPTWVNLLAFSAQVDEGRVKLTWEVSLSSGPVSGFYVWRAGEDGAWQRLTETPVQPEWDNGNRAGYVFEDTTVTAGTTYAYRLESVTGATFGPWTVNVPAASHATYAGRTFLPLLAH